MAQPQGNDSEPIRSRDELFEVFRGAVKPPTEFRIGAEAEKIGLFEKSAKPIAYEGEGGVVDVMHALVEKHGWVIQGDKTPLLALEKNHASVTLEPGAQLELSGAPLVDIHAVDAEMRAHLVELRSISDEMRARTGEGVAWFGLGFQPLATLEDLSWVPKLRYGVMRKYLPTRGRFGPDMMRRTATVQANFDYSSEENAIRALKMTLRLAPFFTALFANSPFYEGARFGGKSYRANVWLDVDPSRQGLLPTVLSGPNTFEPYLEWALDAPMFMFLRDGAVVPNTGQTFRAFLADGFEGHRATHGDWVTHLNTMFPEVRLKRTLEVRGGDSLPADEVAGPAALFTGLLYDPKSFDAVEELVSSFRFDELESVRPEIAKKGLEATFRGKPVGEVALAALDLARAGLERRAIRRADGKTEAVYLEGITERATKLRSPADAMLDQVDRAVKAGTDERSAIVQSLFTHARL